MRRPVLRLRRPGRGLLAVWWCLLLPIVVWGPVARGDRPAATRPAGKRAAGTRPAWQPNVVSFQPGIRIDWTRLQVEVDATVILRQGAIELFACSPQIREHESIVRIEARPLHLYQALGLIGLAPGHPVRFNPETNQTEAATGEAVEIAVRYRDKGTTRQEPIERWMRDARTGRPIDPQPWVFAGSAPTEDGAIAADSEGTVIAVVDFASALIALPERHSDRNEELWLDPDPSRIPPEKTACTLIFRLGPLRLGLDSTGRVRVADRTATLSEVARVVHQARGEHRDRRIRVRIDPNCPRQAEPALLRLLKDLQVPKEAITISRPATSSAPAHDPQALSTWVRDRLPAAISAGQAGQRLTGLLGPADPRPAGP